MKLIIRWEPEKLAVLMDDIRYRVQPHCDMFLSANNFLEFAPLGSNKATGLKVLSDYLGLDMNEVVAVGDNFNDMDMIMAAGLGIAVNNAVEEVKAIADYITQADNDNNAIKEVVEMVLKEYK
jgi:hydroxymethylpyrimidine pyrophosphatase-like HAD family hydrolase